MKKSFVIAISCALFSVAATAEQKFSPAHDAVQRHFKSGQEKTAKDAMWTAKSIFKVGVVPNGASRNGYAEYVCEVMYENGFKGKGVWVHVVDIVALTRTGKWNKLGEARCL